MKSEKYERYLRTDIGRDLISKHKYDEMSLWRITSEADTGHGGKDMGIVNGKLDDVIEYAVNLPGFWAYGSGGKINPLGPIPVITAANNEAKIAKQREIVELEHNLLVAKEELRNMC